MKSILSNKLVIVISMSVLMFAYVSLAGGSNKRNAEEIDQSIFPGKKPTLEDAGYDAERFERIFSQWIVKNNQKPAPKYETGRFVLVSGTYKFALVKNGDVTAVDRQGLFRIDTATGETSIFREQFNKDNDSQISYWEPIKEN